MCNENSVVLSGLARFFARFRPGAEAPGYFQKSLRDLNRLVHFSQR